MLLSLCSGLYPQLAIADDCNSYRRDSSQVYHTKVCSTSARPQPVIGSFLTLYPLPILRALLALAYTLLSLFTFQSAHFAHLPTSTFLLFTHFIYPLPTLFTLPFTHLAYPLPTLLTLYPHCLPFTHFIYHYIELTFLSRLLSPSPLW